MLTDLLFILLAVHAAIGLVSGALVAIGAILEARENPHAFTSRRDRAQLCAQIFCITLLPLLMWSLSLYIHRRRQ